MSGGDRLVPCVGAVVHDPTGRLLVVRRANEPGAGLWSLPGGRVESGEDDAAAVVREVAEETSLTVDVGPLVGEVRRPGVGSETYVIRDYACTPRGTAAVAGDDASDVRWVTLAELDRLPLVPLLRETLAGWGVLPR
jgi:ADP-ribose pyrophosphatase YjhB (NUDIX family)